MSDLESVMARLHAGATIKVVRSSTGQKAIAVARGWFPLPRIVRLEADEIAVVEVALQVRQRREQTPRAG